MHPQFLPDPGAHCAPKTMLVGRGVRLTRGKTRIVIPQYMHEDYIQKCNGWFF